MRNKGRDDIMIKSKTSRADHLRKDTAYLSAKKVKAAGGTVVDLQFKKYINDFAKTVSDIVDANYELQEAYLDSVRRLVLAAEYKDEDTGDHTTRIGRYSALMAEKLGLPKKAVQNILHASPMHDVGKIGIPDSILLKPGKLTDKEFEIIKTHTTIGADILADAGTELLQAAQLIAVSHHENWNGKGYPQGLAGENIPLMGRIVKLVDVFDALTSRRPYQAPYPVETACDIIMRERGKQFDPALVDIFMASIGEIIKIKEEVGSPEETRVPDFIY